MGGRGSSFESQGYSSKMRNAEGKIYRDEIESAVLLDNRGNVIFNESSGERSAVHFSKEQLKQMRNANLTHNHPSNSTFSSEDIAVLTQHGLRSIRATGENRTYQLTKIKGSVANLNFHSDFKTAMQQNKKVTDKMYKDYEKQYNRGKISYTEFQNKMPELNTHLNRLNSEWLKKNSKKYGYKYSVIERR